MKPDVLTDKERKSKLFGTETEGLAEDILLEAQRDADVEWYEEREKKFRAIWWASHLCHISSKYCDDGELQCNRVYGHGNPIDFKRDSLEDIARGVARHTEDRIQQAKAEVAKEIFEEIEKKWGYFTYKLEKIIIDDSGYYGRPNSIKDWQSLKSKYIKED